jgi:hypothetical protein
MNEVTEHHRKSVHRHSARILRAKHEFNKRELSHDGELGRNRRVQEK